MKISFTVKEFDNRRNTVCSHCGENVASMLLKLTGKPRKKVCEECFIDLLEQIVIISK